MMCTSMPACFAVEKRLKGGHADQALADFPQGRRISRESRRGPPGKDPRAPQIKYLTGTALESLGKRQEAQRSL